MDSRAGFALASTFVLLLAFFLRTWQIGASDLWLDEGVSYYLANLSPIEIIRYCAQNISEHPPGYYFGLHFWMRSVGQSEFALRYFSVLGGLLYVALVIVLSRRWFGNRLALLVGALFCVQPLAVMLSRDTRMYTWYGVAVLLLVYLFDRAMHGRGAWRWVLFGLVALVALAVNYLTVFVLLALAVFCIVRWRDLGRRVLPFALVLLVVLGLPFLWVVFSPGPRGSLSILLDTMRTPWSPSRLMWIYFGWPLSGAADEGQPLSLWLLAGLRWVLVILGIAWTSSPRFWQRRTFQWLLALLIFVPPLAASIVFPVVKQRFFSATLGLFVLAIALGLVGCWRRFKPAGPVIAVTLALALLFLDGQYVSSQVRSVWNPVSVPIRHILDRARPGEPIVYTYPWDKFLDIYYNGGRQPVDFMPPTDAPASPEMAEGSARQALAPVGSAWLVVYPSTLQPEIVEQSFDRLAYPTDVAWFDGSRGVIRYFSEQPLAEQAGGMVWGDRVRLDGWSSSSQQVAAGDALRLQFFWRDLTPPKSAPEKQEESSELIELSLVGADGQTWGTRIAAPCNGQCPLPKWGDKPVAERQALYIPADTPPGKYTLRLRWLAPSGEPMLVRMATDTAPQDSAPLMEVEVLAPVAGAATEPSVGVKSGVQSDDGRLTLLSVAPPVSALPGTKVTVPMQFSVQAPLGALEARLALSRNGDTSVVKLPLGPAWSTSETWTPGRRVRTQPSFALPGTVAPGNYELSVEVGPADSPGILLRSRPVPFVVSDREHRYDLPAVGDAVSAEWQEGIALARIAAPADIRAGDPMTVTLVWRGDRPTAGNWKVFVHLVDAQGTVVGQGDAYPMQGAALTPTWKHGEVVVDEHRIEVAKDLAPGEYQLRIGFYNESTDERLPLGPGVDTWLWPTPVELKKPQ